MSARVERRLRVNPILCNGYGYCAEIVPELIARDDWGFPIVSSRALDGGTLPLVRRAVATCPRQALLIEEVLAARPPSSRRRVSE